MKILVPVKRVIDYNVKPRVKSDGTGVDLANVKMSMNPFDEIAVEEAIRLKEKGVATEIIARVGRPGTRRRKRCAPRSPWVRTARSWSVMTETRLSRWRVAKILKSDRRGRSARPGHHSASRRLTTTRNQIGQMLAALMGRPQGTFASEGRQSMAISVTVTREVDGGLETVKLKHCRRSSPPTCA